MRSVSLGGITEREPVCRDRTVEPHASTHEIVPLSLRRAFMARKSKSGFGPHPRRARYSSLERDRVSLQFSFEADNVYSFEGKATLLTLPGVTSE